MSDPTETTSGPPTAGEAPAVPAALTPDQQARFAEIASIPIFGPPFFESQLPVLLQQQVKPDHMPRVHFHLAGGDVLEVTRVIGLTLRWLCVTVLDDDDSAGPGSTRAEVLPYGTIVRVSIGSTPMGERGGRIGFRQDTKLAVVEP